MKVTIFTPQKKVVDNINAESVLLPSTGGEIEILDDHIPVIVSLEKGFLKVNVAQKEVLDISCNYGYAEFSNNNIVVVIQNTDMTEEEVDSLQNQARDMSKKQVGYKEKITKEEFIRREESESRK
jgi:F-type H+-transporting ATPase subunit epsilon